jgi:hypothetical protein
MHRDVLVMTRLDRLERSTRDLLAAEAPAPQKQEKVER